MTSKTTKNQISPPRGLSAIKIHGNPGTQLGRKKGGLRSIQTHNKIGGNFVTAKNIREPDESVYLAEFMGIIFGDGHLAKYQVSITTNSETDIEHAEYIKKLITKLFNINSNLRYKKNSKAVEVVASSVKLVEWLHNKGMPKGNKLKSSLAIPKWILENKSYSMKFIRGLFDTDGCVYTDKHKINNIIYKNLGWTITSYSAKLRSDLVLLLKKLGYCPTCSPKQVRVYLRRKNEIERYFNEIGTSNSKHLKRYGSVAERFKAPFSKNGIGATRS